MTEQKLISKILNDAKKDAAVMVDTAAAAATQKIEAAKLDANARKAAAIEQAKKDIAIRQEQSERANEVENIKAKINAKQAVMSDVYDAVKAGIAKASPAEIKAIVKGLTAKYAGRGDTVLVAKAWSKAVPEYKTAPNIDAGVIITSKTYEIDLSADVLIAELRARTQSAVANMLFA